MPRVPGERTPRIPAIRIEHKRATPEAQATRAALRIPAKGVAPRIPATRAEPRFPATRAALKIRVQRATRMTAAAYLAWPVRRASDKPHAWAVHCATPMRRVLRRLIKV